MSYELNQSLFSHNVVISFIKSKTEVAKHFFYKDPDNKYFRLCRPYGFYCSYSTVLLNENSHSVQMNQCGCVLIKFYLQKQAEGRTWPVGCVLLTSDLHQCLEHSMIWISVSWCSSSYC